MVSLGNVKNKSSMELKERIEEIIAGAITESLTIEEASERILLLFSVSGMLCGAFDPDNKTSSATKCKCGREEWEHPKPRN